jgi:hypothetical protein
VYPEFHGQDHTVNLTLCISRNGYNTTFCRNGKLCQKVRTTDKPRKNKIYDSGKEKKLQQNKIGHLKIKNFEFETVANFKYFGVYI